MRLRPRLCPGPRWGSVQRSPDHLAGFGQGNMEEGIERATVEKGTEEEKEGEGNGEGERENGELKFGGREFASLAFGG